MITPAAGIRKVLLFTTVVRYSGVTSLFVDLVMGMYGVGAERGRGGDGGAAALGSNLVPGQRPSRRRRVVLLRRTTVPAGLQAVANGVPGKTSTSRFRTTALELIDPMASYQVAFTIGEFDIAMRNAGV